MERRAGVVSTRGAGFELDVETSHPNAILLSLLHPTKGHQIQRWRFERAAVIRIGRGDDNHITLADHQVSRRHAELRFDGGVWELYSLGRNETVFEGESIKRAALLSPAVFQLGPGGPTLEFREDQGMPIDERTTDSRALELSIAMAIDEESRDQELKQIVETPFFRKLQQSVPGLRGKRPEAPETTKLNRSDVSGEGAPKAD